MNARLNMHGSLKRTKRRETCQRITTIYKISFYFNYFFYDKSNCPNQYSHFFNFSFLLLLFDKNPKKVVLIKKTTQCAFSFFLHSNPILNLINPAITLLILLPKLQIFSRFSTNPESILALYKEPAITTKGKPKN